MHHFWTQPMAKMSSAGSRFVIHHGLVHPMLWTGPRLAIQTPYEQFSLSVDRRIGQPLYPAMSFSRHERIHSLDEYVLADAIQTGSSHIQRVKVRVKFPHIPDGTEG